jgi:hypothetical protein
VRANDAVLTNRDSLEHPCVKSDHGSLANLHVPTRARTRGEGGERAELRLVIKRSSSIEDRTHADCGHGPNTGVGQGDRTLRQRGRGGNPRGGVNDDWEDRFWVLLTKLQKGCFSDEIVSDAQSNSNFG